MEKKHFEWHLIDIKLNIIWIVFCLYFQMFLYSFHLISENMEYIFIAFFISACTNIFYIAFMLVPESNIKVAFACINSCTFISLGLLSLNSFLKWTTKVGWTHGLNLLFKHIKSNSFFNIPCNFNLFCFNFSPLNKLISSSGTNNLLLNLGVLGPLKIILLYT